MQCVLPPAPRWVTRLPVQLQYCPAITPFECLGRHHFNHLQLPHHQISTWEINTVPTTHAEGLLVLRPPLSNFPFALQVSHVRPLLMWYFPSVEGRNSDLGCDCLHTFHVIGFAAASALRLRLPAPGSANFGLSPGMVGQQPLHVIFLLVR